MDVAMAALDENTGELEFAGAFNPLFIYRKGELLETKADKFAIGSFLHGTKTYTNHKIQLEDGDMIYLFSDGYADQFGGPKDKKFTKRRFKNLLAEISELSCKEQEGRIHETFVEWRQMNDQVDDILVMGVRYNRKELD